MNSENSINSNFENSINLNFENSIDLNFEKSITFNFPAIMLKTLETLKRFKSFMKRFIFPKFHETLQP